MTASDYLQATLKIDWTSWVSLECGACYLGEETEHMPNIEKWYMEGSPEDFAVLNQNKKGINTLNYLLTDKVGEVNFTWTSHPGNSSICHSKAHKDELISYGASFKELTVPCITYKHLIEEIVKKPIDLLVLDIEGHERVVLNTWFQLQETQLPKILVIECGDDWAERKEMLRKLNYNIFLYQYNNSYLVHSSFQPHYNLEKVIEINKANPAFHWMGRTIYKNHLC